jgi:hypothetical protein
MRTEWILPKSAQWQRLLLTVLYVARTPESRNTYKIFVEISEVKEHLEKFCRIREDSIKMGLEGIVFEEMN